MSATNRRVKQLRDKLAEDSLDGILLTNMPNVRYLSGFTGSSGSCLIYSDKAFFISDGRYLTQSKKQVKEMEIIIGSGRHENIIQKNDLIKNSMSLGIEGEYLTVNQMNRLGELFPSVDWEPTFRYVEEIAAVKDESELRAIKTAVEITDEVFDQIVPELRVGAVEREIAAKISYAYKLLGAHKDSFEPIVASGAKSALPHAVPGDKIFEDGDFVVLDFGAQYDGYHADMTRTVVIGHATDQHREIYDIVKEAQQKGCNTAKAGMSCKDLDSMVRNYISEKGFGDNFVHGTGHGLGLDVHTMPWLSQESKDTLLENYVITIEPGIYIPDFGGVRIEDDVVIKKDDCDVLNKSTKELLILS